MELLDDLTTATSFDVAELKAQVSDMRKVQDRLSASFIEAGKEIARLRLQVDRLRKDCMEGDDWYYATGKRK